MESTQRSVLKATSIVATARGLSYILGFLKQLIAAFFFGTSRGMDIYIVAVGLPELASYIAITGLLNFIPLFAAEMAQHGEERAWQAAGKLVTYWLALLLFAIALVLIFAPQLVRLAGPGLDPAEQLIAISQVRMLCGSATALGAARILAAVLMARKHFVALSLGEVGFQISSILYLVAFHDQGIKALVVGMIIGGCTQLVITAIGVSATRIHLPLDFDLRDPAVRKMIRLTLPVYLGNAGARLNEVVMRAFASVLVAGAVSSLHYAILLVEYIGSTIGQSLGNVMLPYLSEQAAENNGLAKSFERGFVGLAVILMPASAGVVVLARPLVELLFERGEFSAQSTEYTVAAMRAYAPALVAIGVNHLLTSVYFARQRVTTAMMIGLGRVGYTALGCWLAVPYLGHVGVALATCTGHYIKLALMMIFLRDGDEERKAVDSALVSLLRFAVAAALMAAALVAVQRTALVSHELPTLLAWVRLGALIALGAGVYTAALAVVAGDEFRYHGRFIVAAAKGARDWLRRRL